VTISIERVLQLTLRCRFRLSRASRLTFAFEFDDGHSQRNRSPRLTDAKAKEKNLEPNAQTQPIIEVIYSQ